MNRFPFYCFIVSFALACWLFKPCKQPPTVLTPVGFEALNGFENDEMIHALPALKKSCAVLKKRAEWKKFCKKLNKKRFESSADLRAFVKSEMRPFAVGKTGLFTGYFKPEIRGAVEKTDEFAVPVLGVPADMVKVDLGKFYPELKGKMIFGRVKNGEISPYFTRREIENGKANAEAVAWVEHKADLFTAQVQGSAVLVLPDGRRISLHFAGHNGHSFYGIGKDLAKKGIHSMQAIRKWLIENPKHGEKLMHKNKRYIFFKTGKDTDAVGSMGVALTPRRSLAVDADFVPLGSFLWLDTVAPDGTPLQRLVTAQDTGAAIKGLVRGDFFWGTGEKALKEAGRMKSKGTYFILKPKD